MTQWQIFKTIKAEFWKIKIIFEILFWFGIWQPHIRKISLIKAIKLFMEIRIPARELLSWWNAL